MDVSKFIKIELVKHDKNQRELGDMLGIGRASLSGRMSRNAWEVREVAAIAEWLDCDLVVEFIPRKQGHSRDRVSGFTRKPINDTTSAKRGRKGSK